MAVFRQDRTGERSSLKRSPAQGLVAPKDTGFALNRTGAGLVLIPVRLP